MTLQGLFDAICETFSEEDAHAVARALNAVTTNQATLARAARLFEEALSLSDMDAELAAIEARRAKTHALKQAMMQELLTGRTRLVRTDDCGAEAC